MLFFKRFKTVNTNDECLNKILSIFSDYEGEMLNGKYNLCLTVEFLMFFDDLNRNLNNDLVEESFKSKYQFKVDKLLDSFKNLTLLKVTGNLKESFKLKFDLKYFTNLKVLELENVYIDNILTLNEIISQLTTIKLNRCLSNKPLDEFFIRSSDVWSSLNNLSISRAVFKDDEFNFVPINTQQLQLQWNQIKQFNLNSSTRQNLTELDLSFNKLKEIPKFDQKELICSTLKVLKLKGNLIDSLKNIQTFDQLEHLDVSMNLICNKDDIYHYLSSCKKLKVLNLIDNPLQMLNNLNLIILKIFPGLRKLNNHLCYNERSSDKESTTSSNTIDLFNDFNEDKNSTVSRNDESNSPRVNATATKKRDRIAVILDRTNSSVNHTDDGEQSDQDRLSSVSTNKGLSLRLDNNYTDLKEIIAEQRKSLKEGKKLLSKPPTSTNLVAPFSTPVDCGSFNVIGELHNLDQHQLNNNDKSISPIEIEQQIKAKISNLNVNQDTEIIVSSVKDDGLVLNLDSKKQLEQQQTTANKQQNIRKESTGSLSPKEDNLWVNEDADIESDNIFIVNKLDSNMVLESEDPLFILVKDSLIYEKDPATGKIFEIYDLNVIKSYELENSSTISLIFDSKVKSKQKVTYDLDSQFDKFKSQFIDPFVTKNQEEKLNQRFKFECLKCGSKSAQQNECSACKSTALMENTNYIKQLSQVDKPTAAQSSYKEDFLNQVKIKLITTTEPEITLSSTPKNKATSDDELQSNDQLELSTETNGDKLNDDKHEKTEEEHAEELITLLNSKMENYDLEQFVTVDHELTLYLEVKIFTNTEQIEHLFECDFSINDTSEMNHGRIVITNSCIHLVSFKSSEEISDVVFDTFTMPLNKIKNIKLTRDYFFHQSVWLTVEKMSGKKKKKKQILEIQTFFIVLKDKKLLDLFCDYLECFLNKQEIKLKTHVNTYSLTEKPVKLDTEENIIFSQFIVSLTTKSDLEISKSSSNDLLCLLFEKGCEIILARCQVIANELKFKKICRNDLSNLLAAKLESNCKQLHLYFSKDTGSSKIEWIIGSYSVNSMSKMIELIRTIWSNIYKIDLQIHLMHQSI